MTPSIFGRNTGWCRAITRRRCGTLVCKSRNSRYRLRGGLPALGTTSGPSKKAGLERLHPGKNTQLESALDETPLWLDQVAVQKLDRNGRWYVLPVEQIAYVFLRSAFGLQSIHAALLPDARLTGDVYVRTARGCTLRTDFRQFAELAGRLNPSHFMLLNRALMANRRRIVEV